MASGQGMEHSIMNLHEDSDIFTELVEATATAIGLPQIYIEKDYWVTRALKHLSESEYSDKAVFKGGTSLSKAYKLIDRFSEDIDLAIFSDGLGDSARKKLVKGVESAASIGLERIADDERVSKGSNFRKTVYRYPRSVKEGDFGQASQELLIEVNAFSSPEPYDKKELRSYIAETLETVDRKELIEAYQLESFEINVLSVKRTLVEKFLKVIKHSYSDDPVTALSRDIRHLYDICLILREDECKNFVESDEFEHLCSACIDDEKAGHFNYSRCLEKPLKEAPLFSKLDEWKAPITTTYDGIFSDLVYGDKPTIEEVIKVFGYVEKQLK